MATPIEATPVLKGKDAQRFLQAALNPAPYTIPQFDLKEMKAAVIKKLSTRGKKQR